MKPGYLIRPFLGSKFDLDPDFGKMGPGSGEMGEEMEFFV